MKKKIIVIISTIIILGISGFFGFNYLKQKQNLKVEMPPMVKVDKVLKQEIVTSIEVDGTVAFRNKVSIYAENTGKVLSIPIKEGDTVSKDSTIVNYDKTALETLQRQLEEAKLSLKSAKLSLEALYIPTDESQLIQLETQILQSQKSIDDINTNITQLEEKIVKAQIDLENGKKLYTQGAISLTELKNFEDALKSLEDQMTTLNSNKELASKQLDASQKQYDLAKNRVDDATNQNRIETQKVMVEQAQLRVNQLQEDINDFKTKIVSPENGTITKVYVTDGESVPEGKIVAEMGNLNDLIIEAYIPETDMEGVKEGQPVSIESDSFDGTLQGTITKVYPLAEKMNISGSEKTVVKVEISMPENSNLKAGYTVKLKITTNVEPNALVIPIISYMTETDQDPYVYIVKEDGTLEKRRIKLKSAQNSLISVEGVKEGEIVVSSPTDDMTEGMKITPTDKEIQNNMPSIPGMTTGKLEDKYELDTL